LSNPIKFDFREWLVPSVLLPVFFWPADRCRGHSSLVTSSARIAQQNPSESRKYGQQSNRQERIWSAGHVRRIKDWQ